MSFWRPRVHLGSLVVLTLVLGGYVGLNMIPDPPLQVRLRVLKGEGEYYGWPVAYGFRFRPWSASGNVGNDVVVTRAGIDFYFYRGDGHRRRRHPRRAAPDCLLHGAQKHLSGITQVADVSFVLILVAGVERSPRQSGALVMLKCSLPLLASILFLFLSGCGSSAPVSTAPPIPPATLDKALNMPTAGGRIQPPMRWTPEQYADNPNVIIRGPKEKGYPPLIIVSKEEAPGDLAAYVKEHKARTEAEDKTVKWTVENAETLDGRPAIRLEYDWESVAEPPLIGKVRVHSLQFIIEDKPRFYRVSCSVAADAFEKFRERFEASAKSFQRVAEEKK